MTINRTLTVFASDLRGDGLHDVAEEATEQIGGKKASTGARSRTSGDCHTHPCVTDTPGFAGEKTKTIRTAQLRAAAAIERI